MKIPKHLKDTPGKRLLVAILSPVWIPALVLWTIIGCLFLVHVMALGDWLATGKTKDYQDYYDMFFNLW